MTQFCWHENVDLTRQSLSRRRFLYGTSAVAAAGTMNFRDVMSVQADELRKRGKAMIFLFMQGGPSQLETFDPKPGTENGGPTTAISTAVTGIQIAEGWERTAAQMQDIAIIRSMTNKEGEHQRAVYQMHTGYVPSGSVKHPSLGACIAKELAPLHSELPAVVTMNRFKWRVGISAKSPITFRRLLAINVLRVGWDYSTNSKESSPHGGARSW